MAELFPLADLRDPPVLLKGARVPLVVPAAALESKHEWCADHYYQRNAYGKPFAFKAEDMVMEAVHIDLSNEDTARWVDRKIADTLIGRIMDGIKVHSAALGCTTDVFFLACLGEVGQHTELALRPHGEFVALASITPTEANIPTARAALLRALFGRDEAHIPGVPWCKDCGEQGHAHCAGAP